jgi:hypothetical protein
MDLEAAAFEGQQETIKWLTNKGVRWDNYATVSAVEHHDLHMLIQVMEYGAPWNPQACIEATRRGHHDVIDYALEHGLPFDYDKCLRIRLEKMGEETGFKLV